MPPRTTNDKNSLFATPAQTLSVWKRQSHGLPPCPRAFRGIEQFPLPHSAVLGQEKDGQAGGLFKHVETASEILSDFYTCDAFALNVLCQEDGLESLQLLLFSHMSFLDRIPKGLGVFERLWAIQLRFELQKGVV